MKSCSVHVSCDEQGVTIECGGKPIELAAKGLDEASLLKKVAEALGASAAFKRCAAELPKPE
jgi:hypothetical protein